MAPDVSEGRQHLRDLMEETPSVIQSNQGVQQYTIHVGDAAPVHQRLYRIPYSRQEMVKRELDEMVKDHGSSGVI